MREPLVPSVPRVYQGPQGRSALLATLDLPVRQDLLVSRDNQVLQDLVVQPDPPVLQELQVLRVT